MHFSIDETPGMLPAKEGCSALYEEKGIEEPRITIIDGICYVMYTAVGSCGPRIALAKTYDYVNYERIALVSEPGNKDGILLPRKINGRYARLVRPIGLGKGSVWISYSPDLAASSLKIIAPRISPLHYGVVKAICVYHPRILFL